MAVENLFTTSSRYQTITKRELGNNVKGMCYKECVLVEPNVRRVLRFVF